jgi:hypothetical protein
MAAFTSSMTLRISRALLTELRRLVNELRDHRPGQDTRPAPALSHLRAQVERALAAGTALPPRPGPSRWTLASSRAVDLSLAVTAAALAAALDITRSCRATRCRRSCSRRASRFRSRRRGAFRWPQPRCR